MPPKRVCPYEAQNARCFSTDPAHVKIYLHKPKPGAVVLDLVSSSPDVKSSSLSPRGAHFDLEKAVGAKNDGGLAQSPSTTSIALTPGSSDVLVFTPSSPPPDDESKRVRLKKRRMAVESSSDSGDDKDEFQAALKNGSFRSGVQQEAQWIDTRRSKKAQAGNVIEDSDEPEFKGSEDEEEGSRLEFFCCSVILLKFVLLRIAMPSLLLVICILARAARSRQGARSHGKGTAFR
jgi:hypothetical protein